MDNYYFKKPYSSLKLHPYGTELVDDDFRRLKSDPFIYSQNIVLSTDDQTLHLNKEQLDETVLRNILYCYKFLDTNDKDFVNSAEAEVYIRKIKDQNPQLFQLLFDVLRVVSDFNSNDCNIAKNLFISRLKNYIRNLRPEDHSSVHSLKADDNAISEYFNNLQTLNAHSPENETVFNRVNSDDLYKFRHESRDSNESRFHFEENDPLEPDEESVFNSKEPISLDNNNNGDWSNVANKPVNPFENAYKFQSVDQLKKVLGSSSKVDEYIVFNYNHPFDWEDTLRELS